MEGLNLLGRFGGSASCDWPSYERIMSKPTRHYFLHAITATRSYQEGLNAVIHLLRLTEAKRTKLSRDDYRIHANLLELFCTGPTRPNGSLGGVPSCLGTSSQENQSRLHLPC